MFCSNCGERIDADSHFCVHCGHRIGKGDRQQTPVSKTGANQTANQTQSNDAWQNEMNQANQPSVNDWNPDGPTNLGTTDETSLYIDMVTYVGKKAYFYDKRWKSMDQKGSKTSWNFPAFFLNIFWLGYRRLYKEMFLVMGLFILAEVSFLLFDLEMESMIFVNTGIGLGMGIILALYGNHLYRRNVEKKVHLIRNTMQSQSEKEALLKTKGGPSIGGLFGAIGIFIVYFVIMYYFVFGPVFQVRYGNLYDYPDQTINEAFDDFFDKGNWKHQSSNANFKLVEFTGEKKFEGDNHDVKIYFILNSEDEFHFNRIVVDGDELDAYEQSTFIEFIFDDSTGLEYW